MFLRRLSNPGKGYFDLRWYGEDAKEFRIKGTPASIGNRSVFGLDWLGLRAIARFAGYVWKDFCMIGGDAVAGHIAEYRAQNRMASLISDWQTSKLETRSKRGAKK